MKQEEIKYFNTHGTSLGNIKAYRNILIQRAKDEIERIMNEYKNDRISDDEHFQNEQEHF